jgi:hypothetical protein
METALLIEDISGGCTSGIDSTQYMNKQFYAKEITMSTM